MEQEPGLTLSCQRQDHEEARFAVLMVTRQCLVLGRNARLTPSSCQEKKRLLEVGAKLHLCTIPSVKENHCQGGLDHGECVVY